MPKDLEVEVISAWATRTSSSCGQDWPRSEGLAVPAVPSVTRLANHDFGRLLQL